MGRKCNDTSGPFNFRGCDLTAEWLPATEHVRVHCGSRWRTVPFGASDLQGLGSPFPATAPAFAYSGARTKVAEPKFLSFGNGGGLVKLSRCELRLGRPLFQLRETRPMHREKPHKLLQVGVTPTPATTARAGPPREVIRLPDCKSGVFK